MRDKLNRIIRLLGGAGSVMTRGFCAELRCFHPNTHGGMCCRHDRTPMKLMRAQPGLYHSEYRGHQVLIERHSRRGRRASWRATCTGDTGTPLVIWGSSCRAVADCVVTSVDRRID
jgi:hypothetical protein